MNLFQGKILSMEIEAMGKRRIITLPTSGKHALLLDMAIKRATPGTSRHDMLIRLGRSLDEFGSLTPAMIDACQSTIMASS
jgi:hypothetical protein